MAFELPPLPYDYAALEPTIDKQTMTLHHDMHHGAYVKNLNAAIEKHPELGKKTAEELLRDLNSIPEDIRAAVRNNGGGHVNHSMFWKIMKPKGGGDPTGPIAQVITKTFGNFKDFQTKFNDAGAKQFGSGWVWLASKGGDDLHIMSTPNQDNPAAPATTTYTDITLNGNYPNGPDWGTFQANGTTSFQAGGQPSAPDHPQRRKRTQLPQPAGCGRADQDVSTAGAARPPVAPPALSLASFFNCRSSSF